MDMKKFWKIALGTGLFLLDQSDRAKKSFGEKVGDHIDDLRDRAQDTYQTAADGVARATNALRNEDDGHGALWGVLKFAAGLGIGIGVGLLVAPANGEETRAKLAERAQEFGGNVRQRFGSYNMRPTGTGD
jgi:gas vesicle protein